MKTSDQLLPEIYEISKKVFDGKLTLNQGAEILERNCKMNFGSARIYILNFKISNRRKEIYENAECIFNGFLT